MLADPTSAGQPWHCVRCGAKFKTKHGIPAESNSHGPPAFLNAEVAREGVKDAGATELGKRFKPESAQDLVERLPRSAPLD